MFRGYLRAQAFLLLPQLRRELGAKILRLKDLADVQELIKTRGLPASFAEELNPYVREEYLRLWGGVEQGRMHEG